MLEPSPLKDKRFRLTLKGRTVDFGSKNGKTYIDHKDKIKRANYLKRHHANEVWSEFNPGSASAWILWGPSTNIETNLKMYLDLFS
jgi:hypothetical protein